MHITAGPLFVLTWALFSWEYQARFYAAVIPVLQGARCATWLILIISISQLLITSQVSTYKCHMLGLKPGGQETRQVCEGRLRPFRYIIMYE